MYKKEKTRSACINSLATEDFRKWDMSVKVIWLIAKCVSSRCYKLPRAHRRERWSRTWLFDRQDHFSVGLLKNKKNLNNEKIGSHFWNVGKERSQAWKEEKTIWELMTKHSWCGHFSYYYIGEVDLESNQWQVVGDFRWWWVRSTIEVYGMESITCGWGN